MRTATMIVAVCALSCGADPESIEDHETGTSDAVIGDPCSSHDECFSRCLTDNDSPSDYPGGFCSVPCASDADCPPDAACIDKDGGVCLFTCGPHGDFDCAFLGSGWRCNDKDSIADREVFVCIGD